ncbi:ribbon-helix-helix domain-containing protein [Pseudarthrobacter raffinosi]
MRLEPELADLLSQSAAERHISKSVLIRDAVRHYLHVS